MVAISCQAPTWTFVRLQPLELQLHFTKAPILDLRAPTPKDINPSSSWDTSSKDTYPSYFGGTNPKDSNPSYFWGTNPKSSDPILSRHIW